MSDDTETWLTVEAAAMVLNISPRQTYRYGHNGQLRTKQEGRRTLFWAPDVVTLAATLNAPPPPPKAEIVEPGRYLDYIKELQTRLEESAATVGYLRARLEQQQLSLTDQQELYRRLTEAEQRAETAEQALKEAQATRKPWWKFW